MPDAATAPPHSIRSRFSARPSFAAIAALALAAAAGAALNVYRAASWKTYGVHSPRGFSGPVEQVDGRLAYWARSLASVEVFNQTWRPMRVTLTLRAPADAPPEGVRVGIWADQRLVGAADLRPAWSSHTFVLADRAASDGRLWLRLERAHLPAGDRGFAFAHLVTEPIVAARPVVVHGLAGALLGALAWLLLWRWPAGSAPVAGATAPAPATAGPETDAAVASIARAAPGVATVAAVAVAVFVYLSFWALIRPPFQTPDEPQQHLRATSILLSPWFADPGRFDLDARFVSPFAFQPPDAPLQKLPFYGERRLSAADIAEAEATPWDRETPRAPFERIYASYPTLFFLSLFAIAQPLTELFDLTPYQSAFVYRLVTVGFAALLWTAVYTALRRTPATRGIAGWLLGLVLLNPMVAFMSSGENTDAVSFPLSTLAILSVWRVLSEGTHRGGALVCLLAAALVKPSAGALLVALGGAIVVSWAIDRWRPHPEGVARHPVLALRSLGQAGIIVAWIFYLWSPLLFANQVGSGDGLRRFLLVRAHQSWYTAIELWGRLGWLDYQIADGWYVLLYAIVLVNLACVLWRPRRPAAFAVYAGTVFLAFAGTTVAGEFSYLRQAGYTLQGRYFLPAVLGLIAPVVWHRVALARQALLVALIVVNVLLAQKTVTRYYEDGWAGARQALPFP